MSKIDHRAYEELVGAIDMLRNYSILGPFEAENCKKRLNLRVNLQNTYQRGKPPKTPINDKQLIDVPIFVKPLKKDDN